MRRQFSQSARALTALSVRRPRIVVALAGALTLLLMLRAAGLESEVGYAAYFGPDDPAVARLVEFFSEFDSGLDVLVVFGCPESRICASVRERAALEFIARLQSELDALPNVRSTRSLLDAAIVVGPLETRSIAEAAGDGRPLLSPLRLAPDWEALVERAVHQTVLANSVVAADGRTAGILVELGSLESGPMRDAVRAILDLARRHEEALGGEIFVAGDPIWTVAGSDALDADARNLSVLMFVLILAILWGFFRDPWLTLLPVVSVTALVVAIHGVIALLAIPMTTILTALPPLLAVIALTASIHLLTAFLRFPGLDPPAALVEAADQVGPGCLWAAITTAAGFGSFVLSDLASFREFGVAATIGLALGLVVTFSLLPALLCLRPPRTRGAARARLGVVHELLAAAQATVMHRPGFVLAAGSAVLLALAAGSSRLYYEVDFGEQSLVLRSVRFMEANFRKPMTTELVVSVPEGRRIYDPESLRLLARLEAWFDSEPSTGVAWSFLDLLEQAYRMDRGHPPASFDALVAAARSEMPLVASYPGLPGLWSETATRRGDGTLSWRDRARVSVQRSWLSGREQLPYVDRVRAHLEAVNRDVADAGYRVELAGGLELAALAERKIRDTQWRSFGAAFLVVALTLVGLLRSNPRLAVLGVIVNLLPVLSLLGVMGWAGIAIDPANTMVAAVLLAIAVDDTIHLCLRYERERSDGATRRTALTRTIGLVGEAVVITSICLALGFAVLMFSRWGGLVSFGLLASLGIAIALVADLLLLPAALLAGGSEET
jgi:predicted RND superfamily exporter protein